MNIKMNLRRRILLGYLVPLLLLMAVALATYLSIGTLHQISIALDHSHDVAFNIKDVDRNLVQLQRSARGYILWKNDKSLSDYRAGKLQLDEKLKVLTQLATDPVQIENLRRLSEASRRLEAEEEKYIHLVDTGKSSQAVALFRTGANINQIAEVDALILSMGKHEEQLLEAGHIAEDHAMEQLIFVAVGATVLALLLSLASGIWIAGKISQSIGEAISGMGTSSTEIAATVDEHERVVSQQAAAVNETTTTVEELGASSRQSATQAESMAEAANRSLNMTQDGILLANQVSTSMTSMKQKVGSVAEQILRLSEQAAQIGGIATVIGELAVETKMLALNAAVEAARAGEHGKGFAVVAVEVRKLADQSKKSAERANALVAEVQKATNSAVMVTEEGTRTSEEVSSVVGRMLDSFNAISATANNVSVGAQQVLLNSKQQASALGQVTEAMKSLSAGSTQMSVGTEQTKKGVQKLNSVALGLQAMV